MTIKLMLNVKKDRIFDIKIHANDDKRYVHKDQKGMMSKNNLNMKQFYLFRKDGKNFKNVKFSRRIVVEGAWKIERSN